MGLLVALLLAAWTLDGVVALFPAGLLPTARVSLQAPVLAWSAAATCLAALLFGAAPALHAARASRRLPRAEGVGADPSRTRARSALLVLEVALSFVLVSAAGLLARSMARLHDVPLGFHPEQVLTLRLRLPDTRYATGAQQNAYATTLLERVRAIPGVNAAAVANGLPLTHELGVGFTVLLPGEPAAQDGRAERTASYRTASADWFGTLGTRVLAGRAFRDNDGTAGTVYIVNEALAHSLFPDGNAVGREIVLRTGGKPRPGTIVGMVEGQRFNDVVDAPHPEIWEPFRQAPSPWISLAVRTSGPARVPDALRAAVAAVDPAVPPWQMRALNDIVDASLGPRRGVSFVMSRFAGLALLLSAIGLYGLIAQSVAERRREIGVRMAVGARQQSILRLMLSRGVRPAVIGIGLGVILAAAATRVLRTLLFDVDPLDPLTFALVAATLIGVALAASLAPALRAARTDPLAALRES